MAADSPPPAPAVAPSSNSSCFLVSVCGQLECGQFVGLDSVYCRYWLHCGSDWQLVTGLDEAISQVARKQDGSAGGRFVWNLPLEATFKSSSPYGWPQLVISCYGPDWLGNDVLRGYGLVHVPPCAGHHRLRVAMFVPRSASQLQRFMSWFTGRRPELVDLGVLATGHGREVMRVESHGCVTVSVDVLLKDMRRLGYHSSTSSNNTGDSSSLSFSGSTVIPAAR